MSMPLPQVEGIGPPASPVCRLLRTKTAFGSYGEVGDDWRDGASTTAVYWGLGTMETAGPDDRYCDPHQCRAGRACYQCEPE